MNFLSYSLTILIVIASLADAGSRSSTSKSSSFKSSSTKSSSTSSGSSSLFGGSKKTESQPNVIPSRSTSAPSTIKKASTTSTPSVQNKPKAVSTSTLDKQKQKMLASQDKEAFKKYKTKADAENDYKRKLADKNTYNTPTEPTVRPKYIPQTVVINNNPAPVIYHQMPNGGYGYGYIDPITQTFIAVSAAHMLADQREMREMGYGNWDNSGRPVYVHTSSPVSTVVIIIVIFIFIAAIFIGVKRFS